MANVSVFCFLASYLVAFSLELTRLLRRSSISRVVMLVFGAAGFVAHTAYLWFRGRYMDLPPLLSSTQDWVLVLAWVAILFYLFLTALDRELAIGLFLLPVVLALIASAYFVSDQTNQFVSESNPQLVAMKGLAMLHASLLVIGIAVVLIGFVLSMMYLVQHHRLKHKQSLQEGLSLPSLARLARLNWWSVIVSVPLITLGMLTGVALGFQAQDGPSPIRFSDPVIIANGCVWLLMMAFFVWLLKARHPAGKQIAWMTVWAFGFLLFTLIGLQVLVGGGFETWHI